MMTEKMIIFGAGDWGKQAIDFFESENVLAFVDNNEEKAGKIYCEKVIMTFEQLLCEYDCDEVKVVVANQKHSESMVGQLKKAHWNNYVIFKPDYSIIRRGLKGSLVEVVLVLDDDFVRDEDLQYFLNYVCPIVNVRVCSFSEVMNNENEYCGKEIYIYSPLHHVTYRNLLENKYGKVNDILFDFLWGDRDMVRMPSEEAWLQGVDEDNWEKILRNNHFVEKTEEIMDSLSQLEKAPLFKIIEIETINRCNSTCAFCPTNANAPQAPRHYMEDELFHDLIGQLEEIDYDGQIELYSANEPFLDPKIIERYRYIRGKLPHAKITILSNGLLLNLERYLAIIEYVDEFIINNYTTERGLHKNLAEIVDYCKEHPEKGYIDKTKIFIRRIDEVLSSRGGTAPNKVEAYDYKREGCGLPFLEIIIAPNGVVKMCSQDPLYKHPVGDATKERLVDIWYGEKLSEVRRKLFAGRGNVDLCRNCDYFYMQ